MPRIARVLEDNLIYHIINRGNAKQEIFHKSGDYLAFVNLIKQAKERHPLKIYAYCVMPNHFHFIVSPEKANNLIKFMHWLTSSHVRRYHRHYETSGHIWQGRYKNFVIQKDSYLLTALRYTEANPVRAGLVDSANKWQWSSHKERLKETKNLIIDVPPLDLPLDWSGYVNEPLQQVELQKLRKSVNRQSPYGEQNWQLKTSMRLGIESTIRPRGRPYKG